MADQNKPIQTLDDLMKDLSGSSQPAPTAPPRQNPQTPVPPAQNTPRPTPPSVPTQPQQRGPSPMQAQFQPQPQKPINPTPPKPVSAPVPPPGRPPEIKPATPSQAAISEPVAIGEYQSSIRTMKDDVNGIKKGEKPMGTDVQKRVLKSANTSTIPVPSPTAIPGAPVMPGAIPEGTASSGHKSSFLGNMFGGHHSTSSPGAQAPGSGMPMKAWEAPTRKDNEAAANRGIGFGSLRISKKWFFVGLGSLVGLAAVYLVRWLLIKEREIIITSPTPRPSRTPNASIKLPALFGNVSVFEVAIVASGSNNVEDFYKEVEKQNVAQGQFRRANFNVEGVIPGSKSFSMTDIFDSYGVAYPAELKTEINGDSSIFIYGQKEVFTSTSQQNIKRLVIAGEIKDLAAITTILNKWTNTMLVDLNKIFNYEKQIPASPQFLDSSYRNVTIKYVNFSLPDLSLDYAVVPGKNNKNYLVFSNSRESIYEAIDRIRGQ